MTKAKQTPTGDMLPILVIAGTISTDSLKDATAYARGLAEAQTTAHEVTRLGVMKRDKGQYYYEIHEGGPAYSLHGEIEAGLASDAGEVLIPLAGDRVAQVRQEAGEVVTLLLPPDRLGHERALAAFDELRRNGAEKSKLLSPLLPTGELVRNLAAAALLGSLLFTAFTGVWHTLANSSVDVQRLSLGLLTNKEIRRTSVDALPGIKLAEAQQSLQSPGAYLSYVRFAQGKWEWAQAVSAIPAPPPRASGPGPLLPPVPPGMKTDPLPGKALPKLHSKGPK